MESVYTIKKVEFKIGDTEYDVSAVSLQLNMNSIPSCEVCIAPSNSNGDIRINSLDLISLKSAYETLCKEANALRESSLSIEIEISTTGGTGSERKEQYLKLNKWLLGGCGLFNISTTNTFSITCQLYHPAYRLTLLDGLFVNTASTLNIDKYVDTIKNPVDAALKAIDVLEDANKQKISTLFDRSISSVISTPLKDPNEVSNELTNALKVAKDFVNTYLEWDPKFSGGNLDIPCESTLSSERHKFGVKYALTQSWVEQLGGSCTLWDSLIKMICPWFMLNVIPTYTSDKLLVAPTMPWPKIDSSIYGEDVYGLDMPGFDTNPVFGAVMLLGGGETETPTTGFTFATEASTNTGIRPINIAYVPAEADMSLGSLIHCGDPPWLSLAAEKAASKTEIGTSGYTFSDTESDETPPSIDNEDMKVWNSVRMLYLANAFMSYYKESIDAQLNCRLLLSTEKGEPIIPGLRMVFDSKGPLFSGLVTSVYHSIDCVTSKASTAISMSFCDTNNNTPFLLGANPKIPFYNS
jgi:hypothetical protein